MAAAGGGQGHWDELQAVVVVWREDSSSKEQSRPRRTTRPLPRVPCPDPLCSEPCPGEQGLCVSPRLGWDQLGAGPRFATLSLCQDGEGSLRGGWWSHRSGGCACCGAGEGAQWPLALAGGGHLWGSLQGVGLLGEVLPMQGGTRPLQDPQHEDPWRGGYPTGSLPWGASARFLHGWLGVPGLGPRDGHLCVGWSGVLLGGVWESCPGPLPGVPARSPSAGRVSSAGSQLGSSRGVPGGCPCAVWGSPCGVSARVPPWGAWGEPVCSEGVPCQAPAG